MTRGISYESAPDRPNEHFVMLANELVSNAGPDKLSGLAMALHHYLLRLPPGWSTTIDQISEDVFPLDSRERLRRANRELLNAGYVVLLTKRDGSGRFVKRYQVFHSPRPAEERTPSKSRASRTFPQVAPDAGKPASGKPAAGKPAAGFPADKDKTDTEDCRKKTDEEKVAVAPEARPGPEAMVSRPAHGSAASDRLFTSKNKTDQDRIDATRYAIADVYGESWNKAISDEEVLALLTMKAPGQDVTRVNDATRYMRHIFEQTPAFDTLLGQLDNVADGDADDYDLAAEAKDEQQFPVCQRCAGFRYAIGATGVCVACEAEAWSEPGTPDGYAPSTIKAVKTALFVATGKTEDDRWCAKVACHILSGRGIKGTAHRNAYVAAAITEDPNPGRFLPTPVPPKAPARVA